MPFRTPQSSDVVPASPEAVLLTLPRRKITGVLLHQGEMMRDYVKHALQEPDVALQLPTGSGKTLVGLLIAEWRRRKFNERVVYLCPTNQLVNQVAEQANSQYGLTVEPFTGSKHQYSASAKANYQRASRVAVTNYSSLFNVSPFFDSPDLIILDDAHAAENYVAAHWTIQIDRLQHAALHAALRSVIEPYIETHDLAVLEGRFGSEKGWVDKIPTPYLIEMAADVTAILDAHANGRDDLSYRWPVLRDRLYACHMYLSASSIVIRPIIPPTQAFSPFSGAKQRIYMSATLGAGGDLERTTGRRSIKRLPVPDGWDQQGIGRRLFMFPGLSVEPDRLPDLSTEMMRKAGRSLVLVPSLASAAAVSEQVDKTLGFPTFDADDLEESKAPFVAETQAVAIVANRYDGIDFPHEDCRLLLVDGQPTAANLQERFIEDRMGGGQILEDRLQTRVLQAIGRCTRSLRDYSAVIVLGPDLTDYLADARRSRHFHPELQAELWFGLDQSSRATYDDFGLDLDTFLANGDEWEAANNIILNERPKFEQEPLPVMDELAAAAKLEVLYQTKLWNRDYLGALEAAESVLGVLRSTELKGYRALWHYLAGSSAWLHAEDLKEGNAGGMRGRARDQYRLSMNAAEDLAWLAKLARFDPDAVPASSEDTSLRKQVERVEEVLKKLGTTHDRGFAKKEREILEGLEDNDRFEQAQVILGELLGFEAGNVESDAAPDPWWIAEGACIVFEDYVGNQGGPLGAEKARQAAGHPAWISKNLPHVAGSDILPVLVTPTDKAKSGAEPHLSPVAYWNADDYRTWAKNALSVLRQLRPSVSNGPLLWRPEAAEMFEANDLSAAALMRRLRRSMCDKAMRIVN